MKLAGDNQTSLSSVTPGRLHINTHNSGVSSRSCVLVSYIDAGAHKGQVTGSKPGFHQLKCQDLNCPEPFAHSTQCFRLRVPWFCQGRTPDPTEPVKTNHPSLPPGGAKDIVRSYSGPREVYKMGLERQFGAGRALSKDGKNPRTCLPRGNTNVNWNGQRKTKTRM